MQELLIRKAEEKDALAIAELEKVCFADPWSYDSVRYDISDNKLSFYLVAETDSRVVGYVGIWLIVDEGHITNVAVDPAYRRLGIGDALIETLLEVTAEAGACRHTLEVRKSNQGAISLYRKHGFEVEGERKGYYEDNGEDALIMWRE